MVSSTMLALTVTWSPRVNGVNVADVHVAVVPMEALLNDNGKRNADHIARTVAKVLRRKAFGPVAATKGSST